MGNRENVLTQFSLHNSVCVVTGGHGLLGQQHVQAILDAGGTPIIWDVQSSPTKTEIPSFNVDITNPTHVQEAVASLLKTYGRIDALVNNAAINPKVEAGKDDFFRLESYPLDRWNQELAVGLTGALICSQTLGPIMADQGQGVIINIASDLGIIAPDQRLYQKEGVSAKAQPVKPVSYSVIKHGLIGLTKYLATYWADQGVRANTLCPAGVYTHQPQSFVKKLEEKIPMGRMATPEEYQATLVYLLSDASAYMNGATVVVDGGRTIW